MNYDLIRNPVPLIKDLDLNDVLVPGAPSTLAIQHQDGEPEQFPQSNI